jgi:hypothetical protein
MTKKLIQDVSTKESTQQISPYLASSADPKQISIMVKGAIVAIAPIIALVIKAAGGEISNEELQSVINVSTDIIAALGSIASLAMIGYGLLRKVYYSFQD